MNPTPAFIWRDQHDRERITIGTKVEGLGMIAWLTGHVDALLYLTNPETYERVVTAGDDAFPMPIEVTIAWQQ